MNRLLGHLRKLEDFGLVITLIRKDIVKVEIKIHLHQDLEWLGECQELIDLMRNSSMIHSNYLTRKDNTNQ